MRYNGVKISILIFFGIAGIALQAQEVIPAAGGEAIGGSGSVSYTVGQVVYTTISGTTGSMAQGVQQPFEISIIPGIDDEELIDLVISAYPNPSKEYLTLKIESLEISSYMYLLIDLNGKVLLEGKVDDYETSIIMSNYPAATYLLRITNGEIIAKVFKIIKN